MLNKLTLALTVSLILSAQATAEENKQPPTAPPQTLNAKTFKTEAKDIAFAFAGATLARGI